jgi:curved DNA-binding protein CbpA
MKFFVPAPESLEELKKMYHQLALKHHPDHGGSTSEMQALNDEYDLLFRVLQRKGASAPSKAATASEEEEDFEAPEAFREIIETLIRFPGLKIEICGKWIWISGATYQYKAQLKAAGCFWAAKKQMWYWRPAENAHHRRSRKGQTMEKIRLKYGSVKVSTRPGLELN